MLPRLKPWTPPPMNYGDILAEEFFRQDAAMQQRIIEWWGGLNPFSRRRVTPFTPSWYNVGKPFNWSRFRPYLESQNRLNRRHEERLAHQQRYNEVQQMLAGELQKIVDLIVYESLKDQTDRPIIDFGGRTYRTLPIANKDAPDQPIEQRFSFVWHDINVVVEERRQVIEVTDVVGLGVGSA
jgi:hypothetical protein